MERKRKIGLGFYEKITEFGYNVTVKNREYLDFINDNPNIPVLEAFNHSSMDDMFGVIYAMRKYAPRRLENTVIPVSEHHARFFKYPPYAAVVKIGRVSGFGLPEIVQPYRRHSRQVQEVINENTPLSAKEKRRLEKIKKEKRKEQTLDLKLGRIIKSELRNGLTVIMAPEAHRNESGLIPAEAGAGWVLSLMDEAINKGEIENAYTVPFGLVFDNYKGEGLHYKPFKKAEVEIIVGKPITPKEILSQASQFAQNNKELIKVSSHILMIHLANLLPEEMRGYYGPDIVLDTIKGRYEQRMDENKKVYVHDNWMK